jgi:hypothetical protein
MAETADYDPGGWKGHDFTAARKSYDAHAGRSYADATARGVTAADLVPATLTTDSPSPLVVVCDVTGSMDEWPKTIFSKLPYLDIEGKQYLGPDMEISFAAVGDATCSDKYPLQVRKFDRGTPLAEHLKALVIEKGGGGDSCESYELAALYYARNVSMHKASKPIMIFIGDEGLHEYVERAHGVANHVNLSARIDTKDVFEELTRKFSVYVVRKYYGRNEAGIQAQWASLLGEDHVVPLDDPGRVVDVIFGILAKETGKIDYFRKELEGRQNAAQIATVYQSLKTVHANVPKTKAAKGRSVMHLPEGTKTKGLLGK